MVVLSQPGQAGDREAVVVLSLLRCGGPWHAPSRDIGSGSDRVSQLVEGDRHPPSRWLVSGQLVVPASNVLDQRMPHKNHPGAAVLLEPSHRPQPCLQPAVITLDAVVGIPVGAMPRRWQQLLQHARVDRRLIGW
jgi:hypothetical protein